jgi:hypothetical protein
MLEDPEDTTDLHAVLLAWVRQDVGSPDLERVLTPIGK